MKLTISAVAVLTTSLLAQAPEPPVAGSSPLEFRVLADHTGAGATLAEDHKRLVAWLHPQTRLSVSG